MIFLFLFAFSCASLFGAVNYDPPNSGNTACDSHPCAITVTGGDAGELQGVFDDIGSLIQRGDQIILEAGETWVGNFTITSTPDGASGVLLVTSTLESRCPAAGVRATPSQAPNMPTLSNGGGSTSAPTLALNDGATPGAFITFRCLRVINWHDEGAGSGSDAFRVGNITAETEAELPHDIIIERCLISGSVGSDVEYTSNGIANNGKDVTARDNFVYEIKNDSEAHGYAAGGGVDTATVTNNYFAASGISWFAGGGVDGTPYPLDPNLVMTGFYNYLTRPTRYNDVAGVVVKNLWEVKQLAGGDFQYNVFTNSWQGTDQVGQAWSLNARFSGPGFDATDMTIDTGANTVTTDYGNAITTDGLIVFAAGVAGTIPGGLEVCTASAPCHPINIIGNQLQLSTTMGGSAIDITSTGTAPYTMRDFEDWTNTKNVSLTHNVVRGSKATYSLLGSDGDYGDIPKLYDFEIAYNLFEDIGLNYNRPGDTNRVTYGRFYNTAGSGGHIHHNTTVPHDSQDPAPTFSRGFAMGGDAMAADFVYENELAPGGALPYRSDGLGGGEESVDARFSGMSAFQNFTAMDMASGAWDMCSITCDLTDTAAFFLTGAQWDANYMEWVDPDAGDYTLGAMSPFIAASTTGGPIGVDMTLLPRISALDVVAMATTATMTFTLSGPIDDATSTQPCVLEVTTSDNIETDAGTYTVVNDLNPAFFPGRDASNNMDARFSMMGSTATWVIGNDSSEMDVDGNLKDLRLAPVTTYYYRLMCYGDTRTGSFQTLPDKPTIRGRSQMLGKTQIQ